MIRNWLWGLTLTVFAQPGFAVVGGTSDGEWYSTLIPTAVDAAERHCEDHLREVHAGAADGVAALAREYEHYQTLVEQALAYRSRTIELGLRMKSEPVLSGNDLKTLNEGMLAHLELRKALMEVAESHECWLDSEELPATLPPRQRLEGIMLSLSAALVLYDNYLLAVSLFEEDARLRRVLNDSDSGYGIGREILTGIALSYNSIRNRARVRAAIAFYEQQKRKLGPSAKAEPRMRYLAALIDQSPSYAMTKAVSPAYVMGRKLRFMERLTQDQLTEIANGGVSLFSMLFGNAVGLVETRKGKLYGRDEVVTRVAGRLRAGDILLEKTPFRLTDALIPGHWGHAAVWIGSEADLRELGLWDHPLVLPHRETIRAGAGVVEALRSGVELNPLGHFLNVDDLAVLRARDLGGPERAAVVLNALRQLGKDYDFNFDVETTDRIVCSELVYVTHTHIQWPTTKTLGRATISPDQVAAKALPGGPLELLLLFEDGKPVDKRPQARLSTLLGSQSDTFVSLRAGDMR